MDSLATEQAPAAHIQLRRRHRACQATLGALGHSRHQQRRLKQAVVNPERDVGFSTAHRFLDTGTLPVCNSCGIVHGWSENVPSSGHCGRGRADPSRVTWNIRRMPVLTFDAVEAAEERAASERPIWCSRVRTTIASDCGDFPRPIGFISVSNARYAR